MRLDSRIHICSAPHLPQDFYNMQGFFETRKPDKVFWLNASIVGCLARISHRNDGFSLVL